MTSEPEISSPGRVLVADDDPSIRRLVTAVLRRADYDVDTAENGRVVLQMLDVRTYDVVVLDLMMPEVSGFDVLRRTSAQKPCPSFVIMSAASQDVLERAVGANVFTALRKPFDIEELTAAVSACIRITKTTD